MRFAEESLQLWLQILSDKVGTFGRYAQDGRMQRGGSETGRGCAIKSLLVAQGFDRVKFGGLHGREPAADHADDDQDYC